MAVLSSPGQVTDMILLIAELRHDTQSVSDSVSLSEAESVSDGDSEALNPRNRLPESRGTGLYVL